MPIPPQSPSPAAACRWLALLCLVCCLAGCTTTYAPEPIDITGEPAGIQTRSKEGVTVSTTILSDDDAATLYGVDLATFGLQAIWLKVENASENAYWLLVSALDAEYFPPDEAAVLFYGQLAKDDEGRLTQRFRELAIPLRTAAGATSEGFVLAPLHEGGRYVGVKLRGEQHLLDFGFAVTLPTGDFDFEDLDPGTIYGGQPLPSFGLDELRQALRSLPCCVTGKDGEDRGDPLNIVLIGNIDELLASLSRGGWAFTHRIGPESIKRLVGASLSGTAYSVAPISSLYAYGRAQDIALQRSRNTILQRNHMRLWLAPFRFQERSVWVGQISRDINIKATTKSPSLTTHVIDPNVDEAREHLLQSLLVTGAIDNFGFVRGIDPVTEDEPRYNLTDDPYFTDGLRLVATLTGTRVTPPEEIRFYEWQHSADPLAGTARSGRARAPE